MSRAQSDRPADPQRREFLRASATLGGGLLIGISLDGCSEKPTDVAVTATVAPAVQQNAWLSISTDGQITFYSGQSEMGQGVYTALPTLLAEELEVPVGSVQVVAGEAGAVVVSKVAGLLSRFYAGLPPVALNPSSYIQRFEREIDERRRELAMPDYGMPSELVSAITLAQANFLRAKAELLCKRIRGHQIGRAHV